MLTKKDRDWLNHLSDTNYVKIVPFDPYVKQIFENQKKEIKKYLRNAPVEHKGATSLGISGKGDIDIYIPVNKDKFDYYFNKLIKILGEPGSIYPYERIRWNKVKEGFEIEIFLMNKAHPAWIRSVVFEEYLKTHKEDLENYRKLKEELSGVSTREYYRRKIEFINVVLKKARKE